MSDPVMLSSCNFHELYRSCKISMDDILRSNAMFSLLFYFSLSLMQRKTLDKKPEETTMCNPDA